MEDMGRRVATSKDMRRVAYMECTGDLFPEVARVMQDERGWRAVYFSGAAYMQSHLERRFPGAIFHDNYEAVRGRPPRTGAPWDLPPVDQGLLSSMSHAEPIALSMMDRMDPDGAFNFHERKRLYQRHLQIGLALLDRLQPDLVVFSSAPHLMYDYVIYQLCGLHKIPVVVVTETAIDGLIFLTPAFEEASRELASVYRDLSEAKAEAVLSPRAEAYWLSLEGDYSKAIPKYISELHAYVPTGRKELPVEHDLAKRMAAIVLRFGTALDRPRPILPPENRDESGADGGWLIRGLFARVMRICSFVIRSLLLAIRGPIDAVRDLLGVVYVARDLHQVLCETGRGNPSALYAAMVCTCELYRAVETEYPVQLQPTESAPANYLKQYGIPAEESELSYIEYWLFRLIALRRKRRLIGEYQRVARPITTSQPYIYVPLHYQPEESTSPLGGVYVDQLLVVELLSKTVPNGWLVVVRENPFQFNKRGSGEMSRPLEFYRRMEALQNVRLASFDVSPFDLIDRARAVATVTGTSGWEAVVRGVPALVFGTAWYLECEGVFTVAKLEHCREALRKIAAGYKPDRAKVKLFLTALEKVGFRGYTTPDLRDMAGISAAQNVLRFVEVLKQHENALP
jgi:Capsule polysaccharide biosynthesis protein